MRWIHALCFALIAACGGDKDGTVAPTDSGATTGDDDDDDVIVDTGTDDTGGPLAIDATYIVVTSTFGYDPVGDVAVGYEDPNAGPQPLSLSVVLADSSVAATGQLTASNSCAITLSTNQPQPLGSFVTATGVWWGFEMPANSTITDGCVGYQLPAFFNGDAAAQVARWSWGAAVSEIDPALKAEIENQLSEADYNAVKPYLIGTGAWSTAFEGVLNPEGYLTGAGVAYEADGNFAIAVDPSGQALGIPAMDVWDGTTLARGIYTVGSQPVGPAELLTY